MILSATGHRPDKLGGYSPKVSDAIFCTAFHGLQSIAPSEVITGMAIGWDMAVAEAAYLLGIPFKAYVPFEGQESKWPRASQTLYGNLLYKAAEVVICCDGGYAGWKMQRRNTMMMDDGDEVFALYNGDETGGTHNAIVYANGKGMKIHNQWEQWLMHSGYKDPRGEPRDGAVRAPDPLDPTGWKWANPGQMWFSTITMVATEVYNYGQWRPIYPEEGEDGQPIHGAEGEAAEGTKVQGAQTEVQELPERVAPTRTATRGRSRTPARR